MAGYGHHTSCLCCPWCCGISWGAAWLPQQGQVGTGVKRIQAPPPWPKAHREQGPLLPLPSLLLLRAGCLGGDQLSGAQLCGWHRDAVGRWSGR